MLFQDLPTRRARSITFAIAGLLGVLATSLRANELPARLQSYIDQGVFASIDIATPMVTATAGEHFHELTPESQQEFCQITLDLIHVQDGTVTQGQVLSESGATIVTCS